MVYDFWCLDCGNVQEDECSVNEFKSYTPVCVKCGGVCKYRFSPTKVHFVLKDGQSGSWPSKGERFKKFRAKASEDAARRQKDRYTAPSLVPNFQGKETETWTEAKEKAADAIGPDAAATYNDKVKSETQ